MEEALALAAGRPTAQPTIPDIRATHMNVELFRSVCYIVCGVVMEGARVLMIQEAKPSCRGKWYLPAGRMERNETIVNAVKREVKEESGLDFEPEALLSVECHTHTWVRFTLGGKIVGGALKTLAEADSESLQAQWYPANKTELLKSVDLRAHDILHLIEVAQKWYDNGKPYSGLPVTVGHVSCSLRVVLVHETMSHDLKVLVSAGDEGERAGQSRLPVCLLSYDGGGVIRSAVRKTLKECGYKKEFIVVGVLQLEHVGQVGTLDGFCLSLLVRAESGDLVRGAPWRWEVGEEERGKRLRTALRDHTPSCAALIDLTNQY